MSVSDARERFRALLASDRCVVPASVFDPMSARLAEANGFEFGMFAGSVASLTVLGAPDLIVLTLSELAEQARRVTRGADLPILVDADHGFGNALNAMRTVAELEAAGIAALTIEDTDLPEPYASGGKPRLIPLEEGVGKMKGALAGRSDPALTVIGRTGAVSITGLEDAIARCRAYEAAGVDAVFLTGIKTRAQLEAVCAAVKVPVLLGVIGPEIDDLDYLAKTGVRLGLKGHAPIMAAVKAVNDAYATLRRDGSAKAVPVAPADVMARATRSDDYDRWIAEFLGGGQ